MGLPRIMPYERSRTRHRSGDSLGDAMLSIYDGRAQFGRRAFLRLGSVALGGLSLQGLLATKAAAETARLLTGKSVVFLFMHGGPSQIETFDPKMTAPDGIRSATGEVSTKIS